MKLTNLEVLENAVQHLCLAGGFTVEEAAAVLGWTSGLARQRLAAANERQPKLCDESCRPHRLSPQLRCLRVTGPMCLYCESVWRMDVQIEQHMAAVASQHRRSSS